MKPAARVGFSLTLLGCFVRQQTGGEQIGEFIAEIIITKLSPEGKQRATDCKSCAGSFYEVVKIAAGEKKTF